MGIVSTVTIGVVTHSVYALTSDPVQDANDYLAAKLGTTAWDAATSGDKTKALVGAARWLDRMRWASVPTDVVSPQPLEHPRVGLTDCNGTVVLDTVVAPGIAEAEFELASLILEDNDASASEGTGSNVKSAKAGSAKVEFFSATSGNRLPQVAHDLTSCYLGGGSISGGTASGVSGSSAFTDCDFDRSDPLS